MKAPVTVTVTDLMIQDHPSGIGSCDGCLMAVMVKSSRLEAFLNSSGQKLDAFRMAGQISKVWDCHGQPRVEASSDGARKRFSSLLSVSKFWQKTMEKPH